MEIEKVYTEEIKQFVRENLDQDPYKLFLSLQKKIDFDLKLAVEQLKSRQKGLKKFPSWANNLSLFFPSSLSVEQASSEETARFKAELVKGNSMIDLTGGFGIDTFYLGAHFKSVSYCERDANLAEIFKYNMVALGMSHFETFNGDGLDLLRSAPDPFDSIYVDPARRGNLNQKLFKLADCEPDVVANWDLLKAKGKSILIKASPMLDLKQALTELPETQHIWIISVKNEVKELLLYWEKEQEIKEVQIHCVDLGTAEKKEFSFTLSEENFATSTISEVKSYIIEPMASIMKAGAFKLFGQQFGLGKLHPNSHLYTADSYSEGIPGRVFEVIAEIKQPKKEFKSLFPKGKVNVISRNFAISAEEIKRKFRLKDGGDDFLICTKVGVQYKVFQARKVL